VPSGLSTSPTESVAATVPSSFLANIRFARGRSDGATTSVKRFPRASPTSCCADGLSQTRIPSLSMT
jgi:hypothetical protein